MRRPLALVVAVVAIALVGSACSSTLSDAATINYSQRGTTHDASVTRADLLNEVQKLVANKPFADWFKQNKYAVNADVSTDTGVSAIWLSQLIHQQAIDSLFHSRNLEVSPTIKTQAAKDVVGIFPTPEIFPGFDAKFRSTLTERQARTEALFESYGSTSDAAGRRYFAAHQDEFACASGRNVAHILVSTQAQAQQIVDQLKGGASFSTLAQQLSTDTQSGAQGGSLGCLAAGAFVPAFQTAAETAPFDTPTIVKTEFGYHVILATHSVPSYEESRSQVLRTLAERGQATARIAIDALLKSFKVHVDPRFGTWGLTPNRDGVKLYQVTPPKAPKPNTVREGTTTTTPTTLPVAAPGAPTATP